MTLCLVARKVRLQTAVKDAQSSNAAVNPTREQSSEIRRIARPAQDAAHAAGCWLQAHPASLAVRETRQRGDHAPLR